MILVDTRKQEYTSPDHSRALPLLYKEEIYRVYYLTLSLFGKLVSFIYEKFSQQYRITRDYYS